ncbi:MAG: hypothetical protein NVSMB51_11930 [Solirubrobacteraceae bacterium]
MRVIRAVSLIFMTSQLRIYGITPGRLEEFTTLWRAEVVPLRRSFGFEVLGAWRDEAASHFVWVVGHPDFAQAEDDYYASPARRRLSADPADFIVTSDLRMLDTVPY